MSVEYPASRVLLHEGPRLDALKRYQTVARDACRNGRRPESAFASRLMTYVSDERLLYSAFQHVRQHGGAAPGRDGLRASDLGQSDQWKLARTLRDELREGTYQPDEPLRREVPKRPGSEERRTIWISSLPDRVVARAAALILRPILAPLAEPLSFGGFARGPAKAVVVARLLVERYGTRRFAYAGNSTADFPVWAEASEAIVVNASAGVVSRARTLTTVSRVFSTPVTWVKQVAKALRVHQWAKNVLVFVPVIASHQLTNGRLLLQAGLAFLSFSLCASSVYIVNDCLDLESDRRHPRKRNRPFASGSLSIPFGLALAAACLLGGVLLAFALPRLFLLVLVGYLALTTAYSFYLKQFVLLDVIVLAQLYTVRVYGGGAATDVAPSHWLLTFSLFLFLSLALVKRFTELRLMSQAEGEGLPGRGYWVTDVEHISSIGTASGLLAVLVLALYISSKEVLLLYTHADVLWLVCPVMLYWISRVWMLAYRNRMDDDPVVFAVKDPKSYAMAAVIGAILFFAK